MTSLKQQSDDLCSQKDIEISSLSLTLKQKTEENDQKDIEIDCLKHQIDILTKEKENELSSYKVNQDNVQDSLRS